MNEVSTIGIDLAKSVFQAHGADAAGAVVFRRRLRREKVLEFLAGVPPCVVAMEACGGAHYWGREIARLGHEVRLIAPIYVKPFVKRQKNDAADAEAISEAAQRPTMRFVAVKSEAKQVSAMAFKVRDLLVRQRTAATNALRSHMGEFGIVAPAGLCHLERLRRELQAPEGLPKEATALLLEVLATIDRLSAKIAELDKEIAERARKDETARRLATIPGVGPVIATALEAMAPPVGSFACGRDFAAWMGLTPRQHSSGGKVRLGRTSKMGQRSLRRLLVIGASSVVRWARRKGAPAGSWLARMIERKPPMLVIMALANKMARIAWALMAHGGVYRAPAPAA